MNQKTKNQDSREQKNQKLLATMKEALNMQKTKSNRLARGQIASSHVKQLNKLYTKSSAAFDSIANLKKPVIYKIQSGSIPSVESPIHKIQTIQKNFSETNSCCIQNKRNLVCRCGVYG